MQDKLDEQDKAHSARWAPKGKVNVVAVFFILLFVYALMSIL